MAGSAAVLITIVLCALWGRAFAEWRREYATEREFDNHGPDLGQNRSPER